MNPTPPFHRSYWAIPRQLLAGCYPGDISPEMMNTKLSALVEAGVTLVINLMEEDETDHAGRLFIDYLPQLQALAWANGRDVRRVRFPIVDMSIPTQAVMQQILQTIDQEVRAGGVVYVHCWGGKGRTGTTVGCYLQEIGQETRETVLDRIQELTAHASKYFWPTPQTEQQCDFVTDWKTP